MPQYYLTVPTSISLPADGSKVDLSVACELHRDDSALPNALAVDNGTYNVFAVSDPTQETAAVQISATHITRVQSGSGASSIVRNTTINLTGYGAGDKIVVFTGPDNAVSTTLSAHTLQGITATSAQNSGGTLNGRRTAVLVFDLNAPGSASATLSITYQASTAAEAVSVWGIKGGNVAVWLAGDPPDANWPFSGTGPTPANASNIVIASIIGRTTTPQQTANWTNMTELFDDYISLPFSLFAWNSEGRAENVPTSAFLPTGTIGQSQRKGAAMIVVTPL